MKVRILNDVNAPGLEYAINDFIADKKVIDIKYQINSSQGKIGIAALISALVMYEEEIND